MSNFINERHVLYVGWVVGIALRNGVPVRPVLDEHDNYTDRIEVPFGETCRVTVVVPPPPPDWQIP